MITRTADPPSAVGLIGLAVMGQNLALNIERNGFPISVFNRSAEKTERFLAAQGPGHRLRGCTTLEEFVRSLARPRRILLMVRAGAAVDETLASLTPLLDGGDLILDGGNAHHLDTERRERELEATGIRYLGTGISGGESGALWGPSIMPGGDREAYSLVEEVLLAIAARVEDKPCCAYLGRGGAGHFVKMVHNGIEYGVMQLIAEVYALLSEVLKLPAERVAEVFERWNDGPLGSFLVEITGKVLRRRDEETGRPLVELIRDRAEQKGTGRWTVQSALELGVAVPTLTAAVEARILSARDGERQEASRLLGSLMGEEPGELAAVLGQREEEQLRSLHDALLAATLTAYSQGMGLLAAASGQHGYDLDLAEVARIWRGGCIIRARLLGEMREAYRRDPVLTHLVLADPFREVLRGVLPGWRRTVSLAARSGMPVPALAASLSWFDGLRRERLPASLIQAQRDFFGAHTYERIDRPGVFHTRWEESEPGKHGR